jgi:hypothetical protein
MARCYRRVLVIKLRVPWIEVFTGESKGAADSAGRELILQSGADSVIS